MVNVFKVKDKSGRRIRLPKERWNHIKTEHSRVNNLEELKKTLIDPIKITLSIYNPENVCYYYSYNKILKRYLFVSVKYLNGDGFVITSYYTRKIQ
jgi:hypothetical protein